jgi:hypothetical protein
MDKSHNPDPGQTPRIRNTGYTVDTENTASGGGDDIGSPPPTLTSGLPSVVVSVTLMQRQQCIVLAVARRIKTPFGTI